MANKSSRNLVADIQKTAKKAKQLFTKAIHDKKLKSSTRLQSRLKKRNKSAPSSTLESVAKEIDRELGKFERSRSYEDFNKKLRQLEREANLERYHAASDSDSSKSSNNSSRSGSSSESDDGDNGYLDAVRIRGSSWKVTNMGRTAKKKASKLGRSAYVALFTSKISRGRRKKSYKNG